jgi:hypothetical protein
VDKEEKLEKEEEIEFCERQGKNVGGRMRLRKGKKSSPNATTCSYELSWFPSWLWR